MIQDQMEKIYSETPPADIPWNIESPPAAIVELIDSGQVSPCKTIDMGCGAGNYAIYLASVGFNVTGIDISPSAIALAEANAKKNSVTCRFVAADILGGLPEIIETFDFAYDWSLLHHVFPEDRKRYVETVHRLLVPSGTYLSVCFSEKDTGFGGTGRIRTTSIGTVLYFSTEDELRDLFEPYFEITMFKTIQVEGKREPHLMNWVFMQINCTENWHRTQATCQLKNPNAVLASCCRWVSRIYPRSLRKESTPSMPSTSSCKTSLHISGNLSRVCPM